MKTSVFTLLVLFFIGLQTQAQNFIYLPGPNLSDTVKANNYAHINMKIIPMDSSDIQIKWKLISNTLDSSWSVSLCDYPGCYTYVPDSGLMNLITASEIQTGMTPFFQLLVGTSDSVGEGKVVIYAYDVNEPTTGDTVSFLVVNEAAEVDTTDTTDASGVKGLSSSGSLKLFPNPVENVLNIGGKSLDQIWIFDVSGVLIETKSFSIGQNSAQLDMSSLKPGVYTFTAASGSEVFRAKLLKN
jgi:hypothetical protein